MPFKDPAKQKAWETRYQKSGKRKACTDRYRESAKGKATLKKGRQKCNKLAHLNFRTTIDAIKLANGCVDCGFRGHPAALDFDHLPGFKKLFKISSSVHRVWRDVQAEIAKCEVRCANCHRIQTAVRRKENLARKREQFERLPLFD